MNVNWKKIMAIGLAVFSVGMMGCASKEQANDDYLICNKTSNGQMAEIEDGYFFVFRNILHYADKNNIEQWVPVCNKPDCTHKDTNCNGHLQSNNTIWQNGGKLYEINFANTTERPYVFEVDMDGSGLQKIYEIPTEVIPESESKATFQNDFILNYAYLTEDGLYEEKIISLTEYNNEVNIDTLYNHVGEQSTATILSGNVYWSIRGENVILTTLYAEEGYTFLNNLCRIKENQLEPMKIPTDVSVYGAYLEDDIFTYYNKQEGFYQYHISNGEKELIFENQLEDGQGYILSENCFVECNRYLGYMPEEAFLKVFNGEEWIDVAVPEEVANRDNPFYPLCITSDRIFFRMTVPEENGSTVYLYYMMLNEDVVELTYAGKIGDGTLEEEPTSEEIREDNVYANFEKVTVFESEEYLFEITDIYVDDNNCCCVEMYFDNKSVDKTFSILGNYWTINGIQCNTNWGQSISSNKEETIKIILREGFGGSLGNCGISNYYNSSEYTNIEIGFKLTNDSTFEILEEGFVQIYPKGKENAITFKREPQETDNKLIDNENVSVIVTGYEENFVSGDTINVLIENKTENYILVKVDEASANGIAIDADKFFGVYYVVISPNATAMYPMTLFDKTLEGAFQPEPDGTFFSTNGITSIEEIQMKLRIYPCSYAKAELGEDFINETVVLNP